MDEEMVYNDINVKTVDTGSDQYEEQAKDKKRFGTNIQEVNKHSQSLLESMGRVMCGYANSLILMS